MLSDWITEFTQPVKADRRGRRLLVDKQIKICPKCKTAWEKVNQRLHACKTKWYPKGVIPAIGKEKKISKRCK